METPEGALLQIAVAGPVVRGMAWLVDASIRFVILIVLYMIISQTVSRSGGETVPGAVGLFFIVQFLLNWLYTTVFEALTSSTPGKRQFGLLVIHDNATPLTGSGSIIRNFLRVIDGLPFLNIVGLTTMLIDNRYRRLGDLAAGTLVIYKNELSDIATFDQVTGSPPPDWLSREERLAVVDFAERSNRLSADRQKELAQLLNHIIVDSDDNVATLKSWAHWIVRGQDDAQSKSI